MNVTRGFFRLWLVIAACWVSLVVALGWEVLNETKPFSETIAAAKGFNIQAAKSSGYSDAEIAAHLGERLEPDWDRRFPVFALALGPPIVVFLAGTGLLWAFAGFRHGR